jgi:menaquinone-9 beta-reductase
VRSDVDIVVVGAGPAGSSCAAQLGADGHDVLLVDQHEFPREKPCGDGLSPQAVATLSRLGLDVFLEKTQRIDGCRVVLDHRRERVGRVRAKSCGRCVPRALLDEATLNLALRSGVRFETARALSAGEDDAGPFVVVRSEEGVQRITARRVVASDGATSVIRRSAGLGSPGHSVRAWAIRGYYATERSLSELFEIYLPLEVRGTLVIGYGWVFPVAEHVANIGVGYMRTRGVGHLPRLNDALSAFVHELRLREHRRYGDIEGLGKPVGSPLGVNFDTKTCHSGNILLLGDAAGITDSFTGEGIGPALESGVAGARCVEASLKRRGSLTGYGRELACRMPRAGQDFSIVARLASRQASDAELSYDHLGRLHHLASILSIAADRDPRPAAGTTAIASLLCHIGGRGRAWAGDLEDHLLSGIRTTVPLATPVIAREVRSHGGPVYAAAFLLAGNACGAVDDDDVIAGAQTVEYLALFPILLSGFDDCPSGEPEKLNNALAVLAADFAVSRSLLAVTRFGSSAVTGLAQTARRTCEGAMMDAVDRYDLDRPIERYIAATEHRVASVFGYAGWLGAELAGSDRAAAEQLREFGHAVGVAYQIAQDLRELDPDKSKRRLKASLSRGIYSLPILLAARGDRAVRKDLTQGRAAFSGLLRIVQRIRETGAVEQARMIAVEHLEAAKAISDIANVRRPEDLAMLADWVGTYAHVVTPEQITV